MLSELRLINKDSHCLIGLYVESENLGLQIDIYQELRREVIRQKENSDQNG